MPESSNIEIAQRLTEHRDAESSKKSWQDLVVEILEAVLLGVVAVATAWSAYHAAKFWLCWAATLAAAPLGPRNTIGQCILPPDI